MREWILALLKIKPQPNPAESSSAFFMLVNTLFFQNLRQEESCKEALHVMIEGIQAYPDRKVEVKFRIGEKTEGTGGGQNFAPHESTYPVRD